MQHIKVWSVEKEKSARMQVPRAFKILWSCHFCWKFFLVSLKRCYHSNLLSLSFQIHLWCDLMHAFKIEREVSASGNLLMKQKPVHYVLIYNRMVLSPFHFLFHFLSMSQIFSSAAVRPSAYQTLCLRLFFPKSKHFLRTFNAFLAFKFF